MMSSLDIQTGRLRIPVSARDHILGPADARVTLVEYADFECPYSATARPVIQELQRLRGDTLRFVYRHFPLINLHSNAELAAEAAEVAGAHGCFWLVHDWLFEHQNQLQPVCVTAAAEWLGLDTAAFAQAVAARTYMERVREDFLGGLRSGVNGTPSFFINGDRHDGGYLLDELIEAVDRTAV
jgi:protein-disulfide isomerase